MSAASASKPPVPISSVTNTFKPSFNSIDQLGGGLAKSGSKGNIDVSLKDSIMSIGSSKPIIDNPLKTQLNFEAFSEKSIG